MLKSQVEFSWEYEWDEEVEVEGGKRGVEKITVMSNLWTHVKGGEEEEEEEDRLEDAITSS